MPSSHLVPHEPRCSASVIAVAFLPEIVSWSSVCLLEDMLVKMHPLSTWSEQRLPCLSYVYMDKEKNLAYLEKYPERFDGINQSLNLTQVSCCAGIQALSRISMRCYWPRHFTLALCLTMQMLRPNNILLLSWTAWIHKIYNGSWQVYCLACKALVECWMCA